MDRMKPWFFARGDAVWISYKNAAMFLSARRNRHLRNIVLPHNKYPDGAVIRLLCGMKADTWPRSSSQVPVGFATRLSGEPCFCKCLTLLLFYYANSFYNVQVFWAGGILTI